jgi:hypothetical protein
MSRNLSEVDDNGAHSRPNQPMTSVLLATRAAFKNPSNSACLMDTGEARRRCYMYIPSRIRFMRGTSAGRWRTVPRRVRSPDFEATTLRVSLVICAIPVTN